MKSLDKLKEFKNLNDSEIQVEIEKLRKELFDLRFKQATRQLNERQPAQALEKGVVNKVPTDSLITITVFPVYSRNKISNQFDLKAFANGSLAKDGFI